MGNLERALVHFKTAVALSPSHHAALHNLGVLYTMQGAVKEGLQALHGAIAVCPTHMEACVDPTQAHVNLTQARVNRTQARVNRTQARVDRTQAHNDLGVLLRDAGDVPGALAAYAACLLCCPASRCERSLTLSSSPWELGWAARGLAAYAACLLCCPASRCERSLTLSSSPWECSVEAPLVLGGSVPAGFARSARCPSAAVEVRVGRMASTRCWLYTPTQGGTKPCDLPPLGGPQPALHEPEGGVEGHSYRDFGWAARGPRDVPHQTPARPSATPNLTLHPRSAHPNLDRSAACRVGSVPRAVSPAASHRSALTPLPPSAALSPLSLPPQRSHPSPSLRSALTPLPPSALPQAGGAESAAGAQLPARRGGAVAVCRAR
jgi:hypothetical protein